MTSIDPKHLKLQELLSNRLFRIPQYQRSYGWETRQRRDLFDDIEQSYASTNQTDHFMATIVALRRTKVKISVMDYQKVDIVDGQQRITTLILLLKAVAKALDDSNGIRKEIERQLVKEDASQLLLQTNHDTSDHFANYIRDGSHAEVADAKTTADRQLLMAMGECEQFVASWRITGRPLDELVHHLFNRLTFILHEIDDEGLVYTVFEVLNSRGLDVSWFDRLKSMLMAVVFESASENREEFIDEVHELWAEIYRIIGLRQGANTEALRFAATLRGSSAPSKPLDERSAAERLREEADAGVKQAIKVTRWIKRVASAVDHLHKNPRLNAVTRIQQARLVATAINLRGDLTKRDKARVLQHWERVSFRIYGLSRKDARTAVGNYTRLAWRIAKERLTVNQIIDQLTDIGRPYGIDEAVTKLRRTNCYEGWENELRYFLHRYEEYLSKEAGQTFSNHHWDHIWSVSASDSIEHIMPQGSKKKYVHWLGNLVLLPPRLNSKLGTKTPKQKAKAYRDTGMRIGLEAAAQVSNGWSQRKVGFRERKLLDWARKEWADTNAAH